MPVEATLDRAFHTLVDPLTAMGGTTPAPGGGGGSGGTTTSPRPATLNFMFSNGATALSALVMGPLLLEVPWPGSITWAHMYAGDVYGQPVVVTASISLNITRITTFGGSSSLTGASVPTLTDASSANLSTTEWVRNLLPGDAIVARLISFTGDATWVSLNLLLYPTNTAIGLSTVVDNSGNTVVDNDGNRVVARS